MTNEEIAARISELDGRAKSNSHRIDRMEKRQDDLDQIVTVVAGLQKDMVHTSEDLREIKTDVKSLLDAPRGKWNKALETIIVTVVAGLIGALITLILK